MEKERGCANQRHVQPILLFLSLAHSLSIRFRKKTTINCHEIGFWPEKYQDRLKRSDCMSSLVSPTWRFSLRSASEERRERHTGIEMMTFLSLYPERVIGKYRAKRTSKRMIYDTRHVWWCRNSNSTSKKKKPRPFHRIHPFTLLMKNWYEEKTPREKNIIDRANTRSYLSLLSGSG